MTHTRLQVAALLLFLVAQGNAQVVRIRVTAFATGAPVAGALVTAFGERSQWRSDSAGIVTVTIGHAGSTVFTIRRLGFGPAVTTLDVPEDDTLRVHVILYPAEAATLLDSVRISAIAPTDSRHLTTFDYHRRFNAGGHFIARGEIERSAPFVTHDLLRNVLGVRVLGDQIVSTRGTSLSAGGCALAVGIDGAVFPGSSVDDISPSEIEAIEVYRGAATVPIQYLTGNSRCGVVMIWTRSGSRQRVARPP